MKQLAIVGVLIAICCNAPESRDRPDAPATTTRENPGSTTSQKPEEPPEARPEKPLEITIESVTPANPLIVTGRARTFENAVSLHVRDAKGEVVAEEHVTSVGESGRHNPYEAQLWLVRDPGARVTVEAFEYSAKDGSVQSLTQKTAAYDVERIPVTLMFPQGDCTRIGSFKRSLPKSRAMARLLVEALLAGPTAAETAAGATPVFPEGSDVRKVTMQDGAVTVDFNERLQNVGGSCAALAIRESVTRTLGQLPTVRRVVITAGGSESLALQP